MREILFRGKRIDNGEWIEGTGFTDFLNAIPNAVDHRWLWANYECSDCNGHAWLEIIPETIGQFTGLIDKNGKKVFEGDILRFNDNYKPHFAEVVFETENIGSCGCCYSAFEGSGFVGKVLPGSEYDYSCFSSDFKYAEIVGMPLITGIVVKMIDMQKLDSSKIETPVMPPIYVVHAKDGLIATNTVISCLLQTILTRQ